MWYFISFNFGPFLGLRYDAYSIILNVSSIKEIKLRIRAKMTLKQPILSFNSTIISKKKEGRQ